MRKYLFLGVLLLLFVGFFGVFFYEFSRLNSGIESAFNVSQNEDEPRLEQNLSPKKPTWQENLAKLAPKPYTPAIERFSMHFEVDVEPLRPKSRYFQLVIDRNDMYSLFCLRQSLENSHIKYNLTRTSKATEIFLQTPNKSEVENLVKTLKKYDINAKFEEVWL